MLTAGQIYDFIDSFAPFRNQDSFDNSGLCVGTRAQSVTKILIALDATNSVVDEAKRLGCDLIVTHHPVIFHATKHIDTTYPAAKALSFGIACIGCHTCLDSAEYGVSEMMIDTLGFKSLNTVVMVNRYDPKTKAPVGYGAMAKCEKMPPEALAKLAKEKFNSASLKWVDGGRDIDTVACGSGSCSEILHDAKEKGAQAVITADVKLDVYHEAERINMTLIDAGHYETEAICLPYLKEKLSEKFGVECVVSTADRIVRGI